MDQGDQDWPIREALAELDSNGYSIGADRFARFKPFGIQTTGSRGSLQRIITGETLQRLRFLLEVERRFDFQRDRDGLAFELAFAGYPVIPWVRVRDDVYKRPKRVLTRLNVAINKIAGESETYLDEREVVRAAKNLATRYIPRDVARLSGAKRVAHQLLSRIFLVFLRIMYLSADFEVADIRQILLTTELPIETVDNMAPMLTNMLNDPYLVSSLRFGNKNGIVAAVQNADADPETWKRAFDNARIVAPVIQNAAHVFTAGYNFGLDMRFPDIETIPTGSPKDLKYLHMLRTGIVAASFMYRGDPKMEQGLEAVRSGSSVFPKIYADLAQLKELIPKILRLKHGE